MIYGFIEWKTHAKVSMVVRREGEATTYCHFGTGNYHPVTAKIYNDLSFFTANPLARRDAAKLFNFITGYVQPQGPRAAGDLSPLNLRETLYADRPRDRQRPKAARRIWAKMNAWSKGMIDKLYEASQAGVSIELVVRGICCLRPGVPGCRRTSGSSRSSAASSSTAASWPSPTARACRAGKARLYIARPTG